MKLSIEPTVTNTVTNRPTFFEMLEQLWKEQYTGPAIVHFGQGRPNSIAKVDRVISLDKGAK